MTQVFEEKIIKALKEYGTSDMTKLLTRTDLGEDQIRRGTEAGALHARIAVERQRQN